MKQPVLLVCKPLERRGQIGGLYVPEAMLLLGGCGLLFLCIMVLRTCFAVPLLWYLTAPALFILVFWLAKAARKHAHPHWLTSWITFHWLSPQSLSIDCPYVLVIQKEKKRPCQQPGHPRLGG